MWDVEILPVKVLDRTGYGGEWNIAQGLLYAAGVLNEAEKPRNPYPADVINLSLGADQELPILHDAIETVLRLSPSIIVAAAGNDRGRRGNPVSYPAAYPGVIAVGAVDYNYPNQPQRAPYSNYGPELDVVAPGGDITRDSDGNGKEDGVLSTSIRSWDYDYMQGTSMATPHVSGLIGLMLSAGIPRQEDQRRTPSHEHAPGFREFDGSTLRLSQRLLGGKCCGQDATDCGNQGWQPGDSCGRDGPFPERWFLCTGRHSPRRVPSVCLG